jgi:ribosomal protein RSM22 (predicted rRNA methylase)
VTLPAELRHAIEELATTVSGSTLARAAADLTEAYKPGSDRDHRQQPSVFSNDAHRVAYAVVRMPATYAACEHVFRQVALRMPGFAPRTALDLGCGPTTASWAAASMFPTLEGITLVERDAGLIELGKRLSAEAPPALRNAEWLRRDLASGIPEGTWDLVIASYAIGELTQAQRAELLARAWKATSGALVIVEPGTRPGFGVIHSAREQLIACNAQIAAPCPHASACPMAAEGDWCHFAARLERTAAHRRAKGGDLAYEDEKFSYIAAAKSEATPARSRIVRHPVRNPGHTQLTLCTAEGLKRQTIGKSAKDLYRAAKKSDWGDAWELQS